MAFTRQSQTNQAVPSWLDLPELPNLPPSVKARFPEMAQWEEDVRRWWLNTRSAMQQRDTELVTSINALYDAGQEEET